MELRVAKPCTCTNGTIYEDGAFQTCPVCHGTSWELGGRLVQEAWLDETIHRMDGKTTTATLAFVEEIDADDSGPWVPLYRIEEAKDNPDRERFKEDAS